MAVFNGKEGRWVTTKEGKHRFIEGAEDPVDKRDRDIAEQEERTRKLTAEKQGNDDKPEGKPIDSFALRYDGHTGISRSYDKYENGYFVHDIKFAKGNDGKYSVVSDTTKRISKEEFERGRGADHKKMAENDFTSQIADIRKMPEKTLSEVTKKEDAYINLINTMKRSGYQGSENKDYHDVISESIDMMNRRHELQRAREATKATTDALRKASLNVLNSLKNEASRAKMSMTDVLADGDFSVGMQHKIAQMLQTGKSQMSANEAYKFLAFAALRNIDADNFTKSSLKKYFKSISGVDMTDEMLTAIIKAVK